MKFNQREEGIKMSKQNQTAIGMDIAKHVFHLTTINRNSRLVENKRLKRKEVLEYFSNVTPTTIAMEACASAHYWGRELAKLGHTMLLLPARIVKPFVQDNTKLTKLPRWRSSRQRNVLDFTRCL